MGTIIDIRSHFEAEPDLDAMDKAALLAYLKDIRLQIAELDQSEPEDMECEAYQDWGDRHEVLEDIADEILDRLDELE